MKIILIIIFRKHKIISLIIVVIISYLLINAISIYSFSKEYFETKSDVAIVLGAGTSNGKVSPIYRERINHSIYLYDSGIIKKIIFTGGFGKDQSISDSESAKAYALENGVPYKDIIIESSSRYTIENLEESKEIMDSLEMRSALIISDPLHMKRAMLLAEKTKINCKPSPTQTSMYKSFNTKMKSLGYETIFYSLRRLMFWEF